MLRKRTKLLLIDDDPAMVRLLTVVIERSMNDEIELESLTDPQEARSRLEEGGVDILLTDLEMPGISGLELLRCAKRRSASTQVLFITGHSTREALLDALEMGATDYLLKPVDQSQLVDLLRQAHDRQYRWKQALQGTWSKPRDVSPVSAS
ncbi:MAG: response regulator [Planctomycetes bacterium]|nr:response regulator [Planctomycetota bacterium]